MKIPLKQKAYEYVLDKIMTGELEPGKRLSEVAMSLEIGISPTPVREAYRQLAGEGLVRYAPNFGVFVREVTAEETRELYETREALESFCAGVAAMKMNAIMVNELNECLNAMLVVARELSASGASCFTPEQETRYMKADALFHLLILKAAGNSLMMKTMRECHVLGRLLKRDSHKHTLRQVSRTILQHYRIFRKIKDRDIAGAEARMRRHIRFSRDTALENSARQIQDNVGRLSNELRNFIYAIERE